MDEATARLFTALAAAAAALGFLYTIYKGRAEAWRSREISARNAWEKYLEMAFDYPSLANRELPRDPMLSDGEDHEKYEWFVARMLYAAEEVLLHVEGDPQWVAKAGVSLPKPEKRKKPKPVRRAGAAAPPSSESPTAPGRDPPQLRRFRAARQGDPNRRRPGVEAATITRRGRLLRALSRNGESA